MRTCSVEGCGKTHYARGFCETHYARVRKHGAPVTVIAEQVNDLIGRRFSRLVVTDRVRDDKTGRTAWMCLCDCGKTTRVPTGQHLLRGNTKSCGCIRFSPDHNTTTHGKTNSPEYRTWAGIKKRCYNENEAAFKDYGGRGIRVCDRWLNSFESFYEDMGPRPHGMTLDRFPDVNGNYEPGNCRWATVAAQNRNKRSTRWLSIFGISACMKDWANCAEVNYRTVRGRLIKGKTPEQALELDDVTIAWG